VPTHSFEAEPFVEGHVPRPAFQVDRCVSARQEMFDECRGQTPATPLWFHHQASKLADAWEVPELATSDNLGLIGDYPKLSPVELCRVEVRISDEGPNGAGVGAPCRTKDKLRWKTRYGPSQTGR